MSVSTESELLNAIKKSIDKITSLNCMNYVREAFKFLKLAFDKEDLI